MILFHLFLQNFRSYIKADFSFDSGTTVIVGPNTAGKSNLIEALFFLSTGRSSRAEKDIQLIHFENDVARITGKLQFDEGTTVLEAVIAKAGVGSVLPTKKYLVNKIPRRRADFAGHLISLLFVPSDLDVIIGSPGLRRNFLDDVLEQTDREYRLAMLSYSRSLRQRNALLDHVRETGRRITEQFAYWDELLITAGNTITKKREELINYMNSQQKDIVGTHIIYDASTISEERLLQYKDAEVGAGVTLVGPHRDDIIMHIRSKKEDRNVKLFGSRGEQRLVILQLKLLQLAFIEQSLGKRPLLLLDDIFSELDQNHIELVMDIVDKQQTIMTTTHKEFVDNSHLKNLNMIELKKDHE